MTIVLLLSALVVTIVTENWDQTLLVSLVFFVIVLLDETLTLRRMFDALAADHDRLTTVVTELDAEVTEIIDR